MRTLLTMLVLTCWLGTGCGQSVTPFDTDLTIVVDQTDRMTAYPSADEITSQLRLKDNPWQAMRVTVTAISDRDINNVSVIELPGENEWTGNVLMRKGKVQRFAKQLQQCLAGMRYTGTRPYSIIYRTVARQANRLAASPARNRVLLVYSDLFENDADLNFYNPKVMDRVRHNPQSIAAQLEASLPLKSLTGVQMWVLYNPMSFKQNNAFMTLAGLYQRLVSAHGATVHIANKYQPL